MRSLIGDIYKLLFRATHNKSVSFLVALLYVSVLNLIIIYGIVLLLKDGSPGLSEMVKLFAFPFNLVLIGSMMLINFLMMLPLRYLLRDIRRHASIVPILVYSFACLLVFIYSHYLNNIF